MKKIMFSIVALSMLLLTALGASAFNYSINVTGPVVIGPASSTMSLVDFNAIFHTNANPSAERNTIAPGYEYTFDGETTHYWARVQSDSLYIANNMAVTIRLTCNPANNVTQVIPMGLVTPATGFPYQSQWEVDYVAPSAATLSGNCTVAVRMTYPGSPTVTDQLTLLKYQNVNDLLVNPMPIMTVAPFGFPTPTYGGFTDSTPNPVSITLTTPVDREGQGTLGNLTFDLNRFCGAAPAYCFGAENVRFRVGSLGSYVFLTPVGGSSTYARGFLGNVSTNPTQNIALYLQLYMDFIVPPQSYTSSGYNLLYQIV